MAHFFVNSSAPQSPYVKYGSFAVLTLSLNYTHQINSQDDKE